MSRLPQAGCTKHVIIFYQNSFSVNFPSQTFFACLQFQSFENTEGKGEIACDKQFLLFPVFSTLLDNFLPFSPNSKLSSANSFSSGMSYILCHLGKGYSFLNKPWFLHVCSTSLLKTLGEQEKLLISNFSFSPSVIYMFRESSAIFIKTEIVICKLFHFGRV